MAGYPVRPSGSPQRHAATGREPPPLGQRDGALADPPPASPPAISSVGLLLWFAFQILALALAAGRAPLFAEYPQPGEFHAVRFVIVAQWLSLTLLFPMLWNAWLGALWIAATGVIMLLFAAALAASSFTDVAPAAGYFCFFVLALWIWSSLATTARAKMLISAASALFTLGGPFLFYLHTDLSAAGTDGGAKWKWGPLWLLLQNPEKPAKEGWLFIGFVLALGCLLRLLQLRRRVYSA